MPITLADVASNVTDDFDFAIIEEIRQGSEYLLNALTFDDVVMPGTNAGTLTTGYQRMKSMRSATTRQVNTEYPAFEATRQKVTVDLVPIGARYNLDRVIARIGAINEVNFQQSQAVKATIAKFGDLFINGSAGRSFDDEVPEFEGLDSIVTGTITDSDNAGSPWDFDSITDKAGALAATRALRAWIRRFVRRPDVLFVNEDTAAWLDMLNDYIGFYGSQTSPFGVDVPTFAGIPYVDLGLKPGAYEQDDLDDGSIAQTGSDAIIGTVGGVSSIYGVCYGLDGVHGYSTPGPDGLFFQALPQYGTAGAVKPGEVELGPVAIAVKQTRAAGAFRVKVQ